MISAGDISNVVLARVQADIARNRLGALQRRQRQISEEFGELEREYLEDSLSDIRSNWISMRLDELLREGDHVAETIRRTGELYEAYRKVAIEDDT